MMPSMEDWAAKAARYIQDEHKQDPSSSARGHQMRRPTDARIAAIIATFAEPILKLLAESRREHLHSDREPCCPQCVCLSWVAVDQARDGGELDAEYTANEDKPCTCGADAWNTRIEAALAGSGKPKDPESLSSYLLDRD